MLPQHLEFEFPAPLGQRYSWASSRPAHARVALDRAEIPPRAELPPGTLAGPPTRCLGTRRAWNRPLKDYTEFCIFQQDLSALPKINWTGSCYETNEFNMLDHRFTVAPMMDWTDRHCRVFHRLMTRRARLYTEMLTTGAILHGDRQRLLGFDVSEHPVALQLGGSDPRDLAMAAKIGEDFGYDEINLNVGCPSGRVKEGRFGACLMAAPALVAACVAAMKKAVSVPVTVKCRIGIDDQDPETALDALAQAVVGAGTDALIVHARKAWLNGLSPKENRD